MESFSCSGTPGAEGVGWSPEAKPPSPLTLQPHPAHPAAPPPPLPSVLCPRHPAVPLPTRVLRPALFLALEWPFLPCPQVG